MTGRPTPPGAAHDPVDLAGQGIRRHPKLGKQVGRGSLVPQERAQQMLGSDPRVSASPSLLLRRHDHPTGQHVETVEHRPSIGWPSASSHRRRSRGYRACAQTGPVRPNGHALRSFLRIQGGGGARRQALPHCRRGWGGTMSYIASPTPPGNAPPPSSHALARVYPPSTSNDQTPSCPATERDSRLSSTGWHPSAFLVHPTGTIFLTFNDRPALYNQRVKGEVTTPAELAFDPVTRVRWWTRQERQLFPGGVGAPRCPEVAVTRRKRSGRPGWRPGR